MKNKFTPLVMGVLLLASSCSQIQEKLIIMRAKGAYRNKKNLMEITDKKVIMSDVDTAVHMKMLFNYEQTGKRLVLEPSSAGGLGGLAMLFGVVPEIKVISADSVKYIVNGRTDIYRRVEK